ncbi:MAG: ComEC/Rec2 family competence protein [Candidatus Eisenbacteria bacterium]|nr:ComEC/Rec2 family competence protein [Candidatus Eisenbacteria bacterium]
MWDCGSARFCVCVAAGTGLSMCLCPEGWLLVAVACGSGVVLGLAGGSSSVLRTLRGLLTASLLVSAVGLVASERVTAQCANVRVLGERTVTLRGTVCGFAQQSQTGGSVVMKTSGRRVLVRLRSLPADLRPGDTLTVTGSLRNSAGRRNDGGYSEAAYLFQQNVWYVLDVPGFLRPLVKRGRSSGGVVGAYVAPLRRWARETIQKRMVGEERAFLLALVLGERGEFSQETKVAFRDSGLVHILSVSGMHTALVGLAALILLKGVGIRDRAALAGAAALVWFYCSLSGFQPPTVRAALMLTWVAASRLLRRSADLMNPLFGSCAVLLLVNPRYFWDAGFQLSYLATGSIIMSARLAGRLKQAVRMPGWAWKYAGSTALTTSVAQLGVLPLLALQFGSVSLVAVPANLLGIPLASAGLVCGFCSLALAGVFPWVAGYSFDLTWLLLRLCNLVAGLAASAPHAVLELSRPHVVEVVVFLGAFFAALSLAATIERRGPPGKTAALVVTASCVAMLLGRFAGVGPAGALSGLPWGGEGRMTVDFLDVGQGDAALLRLPDGSSLLVDVGDAKGGWNCGERVVAPYLRAKNLRAVDAAIVTHFHSDHAGGLPWLIQRGKVGRVMTSGADTTSAVWGLVARAARARGTALEATARSGSVIRAAAGGARRREAVMRFLHPTGRTSPDTSSSSLNDSSVVCVLEYEGVRVVFTGDVSATVLDAVADRIGAPAGDPGANGEPRAHGVGRPGGESRPAVTIVKAAHHGAAETLSERFVASVRPDYVVFSVGRKNRFGHPSRDVVESYKHVGARVFRTDVDGCVSFEVSRLLSVRTADPGASHPFLGRAKKWRAERTLRAFALLSFARGLRRR